MKATVNIIISHEIITQFDTLVKARGRNRSNTVEGMMQAYVKKYSVTANPIMEHQQVQT